MIDPDNITIEEAYRYFLRAKKVMNTAEKTIYNYNITMKYFYLVVPEDTLLKNISIDDFYDFIEDRHERNPNVAEKTIETYMRNLRAIFYYFMEQGYMKMFQIKLPRCTEEQKDPFSDEDVKKLMQRPNLHKTKFTDYRNWVMCCFLLGTGVRLNTLANVLIKNIDFDNNFIKLRTVKNRKPYHIPLSSTLYNILQEYLNIRGGEPDDYLFCNIYGEPLKTNAVKTALKRYSEQRDVEQHGVHIYRHTFAKYFVLGGGSLEKLQEVLGHCSIEMARRYVKLYGQDLKKDFDKRNPLDINAEQVREKKLIKMR